MKKLITVCAVVMLIAGMAQATPVGPITFAPGDYDNTANTVVDLYPPTHTQTPVNNQTTGLFRDIWWWQINNGQPKVGSSDFINQGNSLILSGNHAVPGPGPYTALNFTGPSIGGGQSYMSIYDTNPADGATTKNVFDAQTGIVVSADVLFVKHSTSGGVVALYNEGQDALALLAHNADGSNPDHTRLDLVFQSPGTGQVLLQSVNLPAITFVALNWYRVTMDLTVAGDAWNVTGTFQPHVIGTDPTSALGAVFPNSTLVFAGSLSDPPGALVLTNPGEVGVMAMGNESISLSDNVGISVTNFQVIPEPATIGLLGLGALSLLRRRKNS